MMESSNYEIAHDLWNSFRDAVMFKERFFLNHPVLDKLVEIARGREVTIDPGKVYYRARIIDDVARNELMLTKCYSPDATEEERKWYRNKANKFRGLTKEGSYVPPKPELFKDGRTKTNHLPELTRASRS